MQTTTIYAQDGIYGKKLETLFDQLVPHSGNAGTLNGEMVRAANRIGYRWYNDGDRFYDGYGTETAGPAMAFLTQCNDIPQDVRKEIRQAEEEVVSTYSAHAYEHFLNTLFKHVVDHCENHPNIEFSGDLFEYESRYEDLDEEDYWDNYDEEDDL